jgi:hypothetical protein
MAALMKRYPDDQHADLIEKNMIFFSFKLSSWQYAGIHGVESYSE